jgi:hypothetical protein
MRVGKVVVKQVSWVKSHRHRLIVMMNVMMMCRCVSFCRLSGFSWPEKMMESGTKTYYFGTKKIDLRVIIDIASKSEHLLGSKNEMCFKRAPLQYSSLLFDLMQLRMRL